MVKLFSLGKVEKGRKEGRKGGREGGRKGVRKGEWKEGREEGNGTNGKEMRRKKGRKEYSWSW